MIVWFVLLWMLIVPLSVRAAAPTLSAYQQSTWTDALDVSEATPALTWSAGDVIIVLGATEDNATVTLNTPTSTGLTFSALSGFPTNTNSHVKLYAWSATAAGSGSQAITATESDGLAAARGIAAFAYTGSSGIGSIAIQVASGSTTTQSLTRSGANSAVVQIMGDWSATSDVTVSWTPAGFTQRVAQEVTGRASFFVASWTDQGAAGSSSYGFSAGAGTAYSIATVEVLGAGGGTDQTFGFRKRLAQ